MRPERFQTTRLVLAVEKLFPQPGLLRHGVGRFAQPQLQGLIAQRQQATGLQSHDGDTLLCQGQQVIDQLSHLLAGLIHHATGQIGTTAAQMLIRAVRHMDREASGLQHAVGCPGVVGFEVAVEGVDEQHHAAFGAHHRGDVHTRQGRVERVRGLPGRQRTLGAQPGHALGQASQPRPAVTQIEQRRQLTGQACIAGQVGNELILQGVPVVLLVVVRELDFHLGHVHTRGALAFATFATHAQVHGVPQRRVGQRLGAELSRERQTQGVGAPAGEVLLVTRDAVAWAHGAGVKLAAVAVVVAHLHGFGKPLRRVASSTRCTHRFCHRVRRDIPGAPVQRRLDRDHAVCRWKAEQALVVHLGWVDHARRAVQADRIHPLLDLTERLVNLVAKLPADPFAAAQAVAVLAAVSPFELSDQLGSFVGNGAHLDRTVTAHVQDGSHMQGTHRRVRVPGALGAVTCKHLGERIGVVGQVLERHGTVFDEAHRFAVAAQAHHDVQTRLAHLPQILLCAVVHHLDHAAGQTQVAHQRHQIAQVR